MTPFCIFSIDTGDKRCRLSNIAWLTLQPTLQSWKFNSFKWALLKVKGRKSIVRLKLTQYQDMTVHLRPRKKCQWSESPASHKSSCHGAGCRGMGKSCLKSYCQLTAVKRSWHLWGSSSIGTPLTFFVCRLGGSSTPYVSRHCIGLSTTQKRWMAVLLVTDLFVLHSGRFPARKASHSLRCNFPRDKAMLPRLSSFPHSWLQVHRWPARSCCLGDNNWQSLIHWQRWKRCQRSRP